MEYKDIKITAEIPLDAVISGGTGYDEDGEPYGHPTTVGDEVLERATHVLADKLVKQATENRYDSSPLQDLYDQKMKAFVETKIDEQIEKQLRQMVAGSPATAFTQAVEPMTLEEFIAGKVDKWLNSAATNTGFRDSKTRLEQALESMVDRQMKAAIDGAIADAQKKALAAVTQVAQQKLSDALSESLATAAGMKLLKH